MVTEILCGLSLLTSVSTLIIVLKQKNNMPAIDIGKEDVQNLRNAQMLNHQQVMNYCATLRDDLNLMKREVSEDFAKQKDVVMGVRQGIGEDFAKQRDVVMGLRQDIGNDFAKQKDVVVELKQDIGNDFAKQKDVILALKHDMLRDLNDMKVSNLEAIQSMMVKNQTSLDKINDTVNEKLQKTLDERLSKSFESVQTQLAEVYKGLGEMKNLASGVNDLKNVLSNVKTRGIIGEYQLEAILEEILTKEQYEIQYALKPGSPERVDFAIKLPGNADTNVYLPIDSKFPGDTYQQLVAALESGDKTNIENCRKMLRTTILSEAKSIQNKYIDPPNTTDFAIMFLPFEGLYAEVVNMGLLEELQNKYNVNIAGPSTMASLLTTFRMGFKTMAIEKRSGEVWKVLEAVKKEFGNFEQGLQKMKERLGQADTELDKLIGTRTTAINRKLREVSSSEDIDTKEILGIESEE